MEVISLTTGSWFPRTKLHLKEYYVYLKDGRVNAGLDSDRLKAVRKMMRPRNVQYVGGRFDRVSVEFGDIVSIFHEDGLITLTVQVKDFTEDDRRLKSFLEDRLVPVLSMLYELGAPAISYKMPTQAEKPVIVLTKDTDDAKTRKLCAELDDEIHYIARHTDRTVFYADRYIIIGDESGGAGATRYIIDELILAREYEHRLKQYLELHRALWESIAGIQRRPSIPSYELPTIRDRLLTHRRDMAIVKARIGQMMAYLNERQSEIDDLGLTEDMRAVEAYRFDKLTGSTLYMVRLWEMLEEYLDSTVQIIGFFYQENLQKEINLQQFIFLVGSVAAVIGLGTVAGMSFVVRGADGGSLFEGAASSFNPVALAEFGGIALLASLIFFMLIRPAMRFFQRIKPSALIGRIGRRSRKGDTEAGS